ncbi:acyl dehydratase [Actinoplanes sp. NPDC051851]|uniref:acyl dehydratase n=1 Tax=Actinoplanes sp. NPDC051851 TaxID=3154753 RepID=UPI003418B144
MISTALATRDYQDVHHDRDAAIARGNRDIFLNILTTTGLVQRYVTDWAGPSAVIHGIDIRLGAPCHPYDTLTFGGHDVGGGTIALHGRTGEGVHVSGSVRLTR